MKLLSTRTHGFIDYLTAAGMLALPRALGWGERATSLLTAAGLGTIGYSLLTRYELGVVRVLPMRAHLALDAVQGLAMCAAPLLLEDEEPEVKQTLLGLGLFELAAALTTEPEPGLNRAESGGTISHRTAEALKQSAFGSVK